MRWVKKPIAAQMKMAQTNMTYVVDGNKCANIVPQGQYFQLINSTIAGRSDGVYTASKAIPANEVIDSTYFNQTSPISEGAINKINNELASLNSKLTTVDYDTSTDGWESMTSGRITINSVNVHKFARIVLWTVVFTANVTATNQPGLFAIPTKYRPLNAVHIVPSGVKLNSSGEATGEFPCICLGTGVGGNAITAGEKYSVTACYFVQT